jgi:hypothetical protein
MDGMQSVIMVRYLASIRLPGKVFHASQMPVVVKTPRGFKVICRRVNGRISPARIAGSQLSSGLCARIFSKFSTGLGGGECLIGITCGSDRLAEVGRGSHSNGF